MGEANDIAKQLGLRMEFSASKENDELLIHCTQYIGGTSDLKEEGEKSEHFHKEKVVVSMKDFYREYRKLKRM